MGKPQARPAPVSDAATKLRICNEKLEQHTSDTHYDLLFCLNVIDRHPSPTELIATIERHMMNGGLLLLSCPSDFRPQSTPDYREWVNDLNALFSDREVWEPVGEDELYYEYRAHKRNWTRLTAQVVGKRFVG